MVIDGAEDGRRMVGIHERAWTVIDGLAGQRHLAKDGFAGGGHGQTARGGNAQGVHGFADDVFAEHRPEGGATITATRVRRRSWAFELDVEAFATRRDLFAEQNGAAISKP